MSKNAHTPGPWDYGWRVQPNGCPTVGHKGLMVCMVAHSAKIPDQRDTAIANANLISAAPDLLAALEQAKKYVAFAFDQGIDGSEEAGLDLDAAIAKARGEA